MNKSILILTAILSLIIASCASDEPDKIKEMPEQNIDLETVKALQSGSSSLSYKYSGSSIFVRPDQSSSDWYNYEEGLSNDIDIIADIWFSKGEILIPLSFAPFGDVSSDIHRILKVYRDFTCDMTEYFIGAPFHWDMDRNYIRIDKSIFAINTLNPSELILDSFVDFSNPTDCLRSFSNYTAAEPPIKETDKYLTFESRKSAFLYIIGKARERFGNKINLNKIYGTTWNDESAIIDLDLIEEEVNREFPD